MNRTEPAFAFATEGRFLLAWTDANNRLCTKRFRRRREADRAYTTEAGKVPHGWQSLQFAGHVDVPGRMP